MKFIKKSLKWLAYSFVLLFLLALCYLNIRMYYSPTYVEQSKVMINQDVLHQLRYLQSYLKNNGGEDAQGKYPEGFIFINALYGLIWGDLIETLPSEDSLRQEGLEEMDWAIQELNRDYAKMWFPNELKPTDGIFYVGWCNYLLAKKLSIQAAHERDTAELKLAIAQANLIQTHYQQTEHIYLESYVQGVWPADNIVAMASVALVNQLDTPRYTGFIKEWLEGVKTKLDPATGLIPHQVYYGGETVMEGARGSSQSLLLNFLLDLDSTFAKEQFVLYKQHFLDYRFGLPGIREYSRDSSGQGDVDSGPVLLGIGGSASLVGQRAFALFGDATTSIGLRNSIEAFGCAYTSEEQKIYVLGLEPIADAFIAWANVVDLQKAEKQTGNWRWTFQCLSLAFLMLIAIIQYKFN